MRRVRKYMLATDSSLLSDSTRRCLEKYGNTIISPNIVEYYGIETLEQFIEDSWDMEVTISVKEGTYHETIYLAERK